MFKNIRESIGKFFLGNSMTTSGMWSWLTPGAWSKVDLIKQYQRVMYTVITAIAQDSAKITFIVYKKDDEDKTPIKNHPFLDLLKMPNPDMSQFQFLELHYTFLKLTGESYWYYAKGQRTQKIRQVYLLRPDLMQVVRSKDSRGSVAGYVMNKPDGTKETFEKEEILHHKLPNPANPYYGLGPIEAAKTYVETEQYASDWTKNALYNSGRPSGIVTIKGTIDEEQFKSLKKQFRTEYAGTQNAGKTLMIKGSDGIDYQKLGMELSELALKDLKDMTRDDIMMMFRVSKTMLGISEGVNLNNARESRVMFKESIVIAEWDRLIDHLNAFLMPQLGDGFMIGYELPDLQSGTEQVAEWTAGVNKWLTVNDIRKERGLKPLPGGDVLYQSLALVPLTAESEKPPEPQGDTGMPPKGDTGTNGKPPKGDSGKEPKGDSGKKAIVKNEKVKSFEEAAGKYADLLTGAEDKWASDYMDGIIKEFNKQQKEILSHTSKTLPLEWSFDVEASGARLQSTLSPISLKLMAEAARLALGMADDNKTEFDINERVKLFIHDRIEKMSQGVNEQTIKQLSESISEGIAAGENTATLRDRVKEIYTDATTTRATRIARTESIAVGNQGALEAYKQSPLVEAKEWNAAGDACEFCAELDGKVVGLDEDYAKDGQTISVGDNSYKVDYGDLEEPPLHPNCRCVLLPVAL